MYVAAKAVLTGPHGTRAITVQPVSGESVNPEGCFAVQPVPDTRAFRVTVVDPTVNKSGEMAPTSHIVLSTCEPRIGKTPIQIESNTIEVPLD